jgi:intein/homing endonuclease
MTTEIETIPPIVDQRADLAHRDLTYRSYSGTDISAMIILPNEPRPLVLGDLQTISYSIHRESKPVRLLGKVNPAGFVSGPRCIPASGKVFVKDRGYISIADVNAGDYVQSSGFTFDKVIGSYNQGFKLCYKLNLEGGYELTASFDHPIFTNRGWVNMEELKEDDIVHVTGFCPSEEEDLDISDSMLVMLAYLIGDGSTRRYPKKSTGSIEHRIGLAIADSELETVGVSSQEALEEIGASFRDNPSHNGKSFTRVISVCKPGFGKTAWQKREYNQLHETLLKFGMYDRYSHNKFVPQELIAKMSARQTALFLRHLFATDGGYQIEKTGRIKASYGSTSEELIDEIRLLLLKLGIRSKKAKDKRVGDIGGRNDIVSRHNSYKLSIDGNLDVEKFFKRIGIFGKDERVRAHIENNLGSSKQFLNVDVTTFLRRAQEAIVEKGESVKDYKRSFNIYNYSLPGIGAQKAIRLAKQIDNQEFSEWIDSLIAERLEEDDDTVGVKIKSLTKIAELPVYDLEVENRHSFICDFVKVHNTIAGSLIFINFETYTFYRLSQYQQMIYGSPDGRMAPMHPLADMLPPFDILITAANEFGYYSSMRINGAKIIDEGGTMSIEDLVTESQYTFMARGIEPMKSFKPEVTDGALTASGNPTTINRMV